MLFFNRLKLAGLLSAFIVMVSAYGCDRGAASSSSGAEERVDEPMCVLLYGTSSSGKSTVADALRPLPDFADFEFIAMDDISDKKTRKIEREIYNGKLELPQGLAAEAYLAIQKVKKSLAAGNKVVCDMVLAGETPRDTAGIVGYFKKELEQYSCIKILMATSVSDFVERVKQRKDRRLFDVVSQIGRVYGKIKTPEQRFFSLPDGESSVRLEDSNELLSFSPGELDYALAKIPAVEMRNRLRSIILGDLDCRSTPSEKPIHFRPIGFEPDCVLDSGKNSPVVLAERISGVVSRRGTPISRGTPVSHEEKSQE
jgi:thymidylate kinase